MGKGCPFIHSQTKNRPSSPWGRGKGTEVNNGCNYEYCKSSVQGNVRKVYTSRNFMNAHLNAVRNLEQVEPSKMPTETSLRSKGIFRQKRLALDFHFRVWRANSETNFHLWTQLKEVGQNGRSPNAPPYDQRSTERNEEQEEFASHRACKLHKEFIKIKGHHGDVHKTKFFRRYVPTKAKFTATVLAIHSKERVYKVDCGASVHMMGVSSPTHKEKKTIRQACGILDLLTANGIVVSDTQAKVYIKELGACLWIHLVNDSLSVPPFGRQCSELGYSCSWPTGETQDYQKIRKYSNAASKTSSHCCRYQTEGSTIHWIPDSQGALWAGKRSVGHHVGSVETICRRIGRTRYIFPNSDSQEMTLSMQLSKKNLLMRNFPRLSPMRVKIRWQKIPRVRKVSSVPNLEETTMCQLIVRKIPVVKSVRRQQNTSQVVDGIAPSSKFWDLITASHKILNVENVSRCGHKKTILWRKIYFTNWIQSFSMKNDRHMWDHCRVYNDFFLHQRSWKWCTQTIPKSVWMLVKIYSGIMTQAPLAAQKRTEWQKEPSAEWKKEQLSQEWWDCATECRCYLRNVHDKMADGKTVFEKRCGKTLDGPSIPFWNIGWSLPIHHKKTSQQ